MATSCERYLSRPSSEPQGCQWPPQGDNAQLPAGTKNALSDPKLDQNDVNIHIMRYGGKAPESPGSVWGFQLFGRPGAQVVVATAREPHVQG